MNHIQLEQYIQSDVPLFIGSLKTTQLIAPLCLPQENKQISSSIIQEGVGGVLHLLSILLVKLEFHFRYFVHAKKIPKFHSVKPLSI